MKDGVASHRFIVWHLATLKDRSEREGFPNVDEGG
jgi:hypothetical protein